MRYKQTSIIALTICMLLIFYGCTSLGHYGKKDVDQSQWVKIIISKGVVVDKVDDTNIMDTAGSSMERTMTVNPGMHVFLVRYWRVIPNKGARTSKGKTEIKKEVQAAKVYRILADESSDTVKYDIIEAKD